MGQTTHEIEAHIEDTRQHLGSNLHELEQKVKDATDWKHHYKTNPGTLLGVAAGGGLLLAMMLGGGKRRRMPAGPSLHGVQPYSMPSPQKVKALQTWDHIKDALLGVAATRFTGYVNELVPGFGEHFKKAEERAKTSLDPVR